MREQEVRNLWEAYLEVCENQQLDELSSEVISRTSHKRMQNLSAAQRKEMDAKDVGATTAEISKRAEETLDAAAKVSKNRKLSSAHARSRKRMRDAGKNVQDSYEYDTFDVILEHLVSEGYADTNESALAIMANMSEEWRQSIVEGGFNSSGRYDVGGGRTVGPVAGAVRSLFSGNLPKGQTYVPPSPQNGTNRPPAVPSSKGDSGKLTDFGAGGGKAKLKTGMSVGQVERQGRRNKGDYSG